MHTYSFIPFPNTIITIHIVLYNAYSVSIYVYFKKGIKSPRSERIRKKKKGTIIILKTDRNAVTALGYVNKMSSKQEQGL